MTSADVTADVTIAARGVYSKSSKPSSNPKNRTKTTLRVSYFGLISDLILAFPVRSKALSLGMVLASGAIPEMGSYGD